MSVTNDQLMNAVLDLTRKVERQDVHLTTLTDSHRQRKESARRFEDDTRVKLTSIEQKQNKLARKVEAMEPVVDRIRVAALVRRGLARCVLRWWKVSTAFGVAIAATVAWANEWLPKLGKFWR